MRGRIRVNRPRFLIHKQNATMITIEKKEKLLAPEILVTHKYYKEFLAYHKKNVDVLYHIVEQIMKAKEEGKTQVSIKTIIGQYVRWDGSVKTDHDPDFKVNDKYTSMYAALIAKNWPEYKDMFEMRKFRAVK